MSALDSSSWMRSVAVSVMTVLYFPAESGTAFSIATRRARRSRPASSSTSNWVRTAIMPQPMSTPTAAGMIARSRDDRSDCGALAEMRVRHQREVREDERHRRRALGLGQRLVVEQGRPADRRLLIL